MFHNFNHVHVRISPATLAVFLIVQLLCYGATVTVEKNECLRPDEEEGYCVPIKTCPSVLRLVTSGLNQGSLTHLQKLTCSLDSNDDPIVCCPPNDIVEEQRSRFHPNLQLLPRFPNCGSLQLSIGDRIIGGSQVPIGTFPWLARIGYRQGLRNAVDYYCGGSLINDRYILTAAHCATTGESELTPAEIRLGENDANKNPDCSDDGGCSYVQDYKIEKIIIHPKYDPSRKQNDIALIRVNKNIAFDKFIQPICLPLTKEYSIRHLPNLGQGSYVNTEAVVAGWGKTRSGDNAPGSSILNQVYVPIVTNQECNRIYAGKTYITERQLCAGGQQGQDSCDGDSGGPLVAILEDSSKYFQAAIVSFGPTKCGSKGLPGIYTRVSEYLTWIMDNLEP